MHSLDMGHFTEASICEEIPRSGIAGSKGILIFPVAKLMHTLLYRFQTTQKLIG